jgi:DNA-binding transcriptional LysR family regulator
LKDGIQEIGFLADPTAGELRIGCNIAVTHSLLPGAIERFAQRYPKVVLQVSEIATPTDDYPQLREHKLDLVLIRLSSARRESDFSYEFGFEREDDDRLVAAIGARSPLAHRRKLDLADLAVESWVVTPPGTSGYAAVTATFAARSLPMPHVAVPTFSIPLRASLAATGRFIAVFHASVMRFEAKRYELKELPVRLMSTPWPFSVVTLKNRTLNPLARHFVSALREIAQARDSGS